MVVFGRNPWSSALVKTVFGNWWQRISRHSATLQPFELALLQVVVEAMPEHLRGPFEAHIDAATLVQRHLVPNGRTGRTEWRGLHFYRLRRRVVDWSDVPPLPVADGTTKLLRLRVRAGVDGPVLHVTANAHRRHFFDIQSGEDWRPLKDIKDVIVQNVRQSWRSGTEQRA
jgi:hypothetical protein